MLLFKTSGETFSNVIKYLKHAFYNQPKSFQADEIVLISKNKIDCKKDEKQIQYLMLLDQIRRADDEEFEKYWPNTKRSWKFIAEFSRVVAIKKPFDILEIVGNKYFHEYGRVQTFKKINPQHEALILEYLKSTNTFE